jgi:hypothetical protein
LLCENLAALRKEHVLCGSRDYWQAAAATLGAVPVFSSKAPADIEEATQLRSEAIKKMVAFIARNDFERARQRSWDEVRLHRLMRNRIGVFNGNFTQF